MKRAGANMNPSVWTSRGSGGPGGNPEPLVVVAAMDPS